jgi:hypothetical protein
MRGTHTTRRATHAIPSIHSSPPPPTLVSPRTQHACRRHKGGHRGRRASTHPHALKVGVAVVGGPEPDGARGGARVGVRDTVDQPAVGENRKRISHHVQAEVGPHVAEGAATGVIEPTQGGPQPVLHLHKRLAVAVTVGKPAVVVPLVLPERETTGWVVGEGGSRRRHIGAGRGGGNTEVTVPNTPS